MFPLPSTVMTGLDASVGTPHALPLPPAAAVLVPPPSRTRGRRLSPKETVAVAREMLSRKTSRVTLLVPRSAPGGSSSARGLAAVGHVGAQDHRAGFSSTLRPKKRPRHRLRPGNRRGCLCVCVAWVCLLGCPCIYTPGAPIRTCGREADAVEGRRDADRGTPAVNPALLVRGLVYRPAC